MTNPKDYADSARKLGEIIDAAVARGSGCKTLIVTCEACNVMVSWEGPRVGGALMLDLLSYREECQKLPASGDTGCPYLIKAQRELTRLAEVAHR